MQTAESKQAVELGDFPFSHCILLAKQNTVATFCGAYLNVACAYRLEFQMIKNLHVRGKS